MALMQIESEGRNVVVVEKVELDIDVQVGEGGQSNPLRVELGLEGKGKSSNSRVSRVLGRSEMEETESGNATGTECLLSASESNKDVEVRVLEVVERCSEEPWGV